MSSNRCLLIDGHGILYRAFFALPVMTTADGRHTHALFGFVRMLTQLLRCWTPTHVAVTFDAGVPQRRLDMLEAYKAQRPAMPPALREQIAYVREYLDAAAIRTLAISGEEADDVMASLIQRLLPAQPDAESSSRCLPDRSTGVSSAEVLLASADKDLLQLVEERVSLVSPAGKPVRTDVAEVRRKTGVTPERIVEWLALIGDSADNIPGVPGIGPKTATRLLNEYGPLTNLWPVLDTLPSESLRRTLRDHRHIIERNVGLMTLRRDLPLDMAPDPWASLACRPPAADALQQVARRYEIKSLAGEKTRETGQGTLDLQG